MNRFVRRLGGVAVAVALIVGLKVYNRSSAESEVREKLVEICGTDNGCLETVDQHFDSCFSKNYTMGGRHQSSDLDTAGVVACLNSAAGTEYFSFEE